MIRTVSIGPSYNRCYVYVRQYDSYEEYRSIENNHGPVSKKTASGLRKLRDQPLKINEYYSRKWFRLNDKNIGIPSNEERYLLAKPRERLLANNKYLWWLNLQLVCNNYFIPNEIIYYTGTFLKQFIIYNTKIGWKMDFK
jgi:hypothetical protein